MLKDNIIVWTTLVAIICLLIACPAALAYTLDETIYVKGNGDLSVTTKIPDAYDFAQGLGTQEYHRSIISTDVRSRLDSAYTFNKNASAAALRDSFLSPIQQLGLNSQYNNENLTENYVGDYNHYSIGMDNKGDIFALRGNFAPGLAHTVSASWIDSLSSKSAVDIGEQNLGTNYVISGKGILSETIADRGDRVIKHLSIIASSSVNGDFKLNSKLEDKISPEFTAFSKFGG